LLIDLCALQIRYKGLETPLLACDISTFDHEYIDWAGKYKDYDIFSDARKDLRKLHPSMIKIMKGSLFSECRVFPTTSNPDPLNKLDDGDKGDGVMWVKVISASNLIAADSNGKSDPLSEFSFDEMTWSTTCIHESLNPEW
jgi:hypothetical protein